MSRIGSPTGGLEAFSETAPSVASDGSLYLSFILAPTDTHDPTNSTGLSEKWQHSHHSNSVNDLEESAGTVFSAGADGYLRAADISDGSQLFQKSVAISSIYALGLGAETVVLGGGYETDLFAVDRADGSSVWSHSLHADSVRAIDETDGVVVSGDDSSVLEAVDAADGSSIWTDTLSQGITAVDADSGVFIVADGNDTVAGYDTSGTQLWTHTIHSERATGTFASDAAYSVGKDGKVVSSSLSDGSKNWENIVFSETVLSGDVTEQNGVVYATAVSNYNDFDEAYEIAALDASTGGLLWSTEIAHTDSIEAVDADAGYVYTASSDETVVRSVLGGVDKAPQTGTLYVSYSGNWVPEK